MERKDKIVTVIAGPNGAGKTSLQSLLRQAHLVECNIVNIDAITIDENLLPNDPLRYQKELNRLVDKKYKKYLYNFKTKTPKPYCVFAL